MKERPILFSAPMVRAILDGTKTQTRRVVKLPVTQDARFVGGFKLTGPGGVESAIGGPLTSFQSPYGSPGDRLWVRENFCPIYTKDATYNGVRPIQYDYAATYTHGNRLGDALGIKKRWKPSIHMPRAASRITLEITGVRVERLQDISEADAMAEGVCELPFQAAERGCWWTGDVGAGAALHGRTPSYAYRLLWESINGPGSWAENPWVWVVQFKRIQGGAA